jgi:hypothetical protein
MTIPKATHIAKPNQPTLKPKLGKGYVSPIARPKRSTNQQTKKNNEAITAATKKAGFRVPKTVLWLKEHKFFKSSFVLKALPFG